MLVKELLQVDSCAVSDALDARGLRYQVPHGIHALFPTRRVAGKAVTVQLVAAQELVPSQHLGTGAIESVGPGDVIIVANGGRIDAAGWGGNLALAAKLKGAEALIIDGATRDLEEIRDMDFPIFGRGATPCTARGRVVEKAFNVPVIIAGISVNPDDFVVADMTGVVIIPARCAVEVANEAKAIMQRDSDIARRIRGGEAVGQVMGGRYERALMGASPR
jgi:4-hydroxy-4-methyl-2-oxoglutarate aldolase